MIPNLVRRYPRNGVKALRSVLFKNHSGILKILILNDFFWIFLITVFLMGYIVCSKYCKFSVLTASINTIKQIDVDVMTRNSLRNLTEKFRKWLKRAQWPNNNPPYSKIMLQIFHECFKRLKIIKLPQNSDLSQTDAKIRHMFWRSI